MKKVLSVSFLLCFLSLLLAFNFNPGPITKDSKITETRSDLKRLLTNNLIVYAKFTTACKQTKIGNPNDPAPTTPPECQTANFGCTGGTAKGEPSTEDLKKTYGSTQAEVEAQLVSIDFQGKSVQVHKLVKSAFEKVNSDITAANTGYQFKDIGTFDWRTKNIPGQNSTELSLHSFGIAMDINPSTNPYTSASTHDIPAAVADIFKRNGFAWGGDWNPSHDWMHFQYEGATGTGCSGQ